MKTKDKIKCLKHFGFKKLESGEVFKIHVLHKTVTNFMERDNELIHVYINDVNNHYLISLFNKKGSINLFVGTINTEEFLKQVLEAIGVIQKQ